ncbi:MAG: hypothetical protein RLP12_08420, partial [Ekhidna sp.]
MKNLLYIVFLMCGLSAAAQKKSEVDIVAIIDDLTVRWDETAIKMKNYQGIQEFCLTEKFRYETIELLDDIHHWDTTLYFIVQEK